MLKPQPEQALQNSSLAEADGLYSENPRHKRFGLRYDFLQIAYLNISPELRLGCFCMRHHAADSKVVMNQLNHGGFGYQYEYSTSVGQRGSPMML